ncbi:MAG TPA: hypothetical protein VFJ48_03130 [Casimicrobiaceae bacterium]|nr:hypothetical protein [Casimicrobiaceae bacterium]
MIELRIRSWIAAVVAGACLSACGEQRIGCDADVVSGTLTSMVRDRVLRVAADSYPATLDVRKRAALTKATRVTPVEMKLVEWDTERGRLVCMATIVVDAPGPQMDTNLRREAKIPYRVMLDSGEVFLVEVSYLDLMTIIPASMTSEIRPNR